MIEIFFLILSIFVINFFLNKKKLISNSTGQFHQIYNQEHQVPLSGGLFILLYFYFHYEFFNMILIFYLSFFFILGVLTDLNIIKSPSYRFLTQIILLLFFISQLNISIYDVRIEWINFLLENNYFNIFLVLFCFLVLINGSNFIDGNNGLTLGYFLIIFLIVLNLVNKKIIFYDETFIFSFLVILTILLTLNLLNKLYLGDSGVYLLALFTGYILIGISSKNPDISPYFIANILWYPSFEILFSLIRKVKSKFSPLNPDTQHLHQLLFYYYLKKINLRKSYLNSLTGITINIYNCAILYLASTVLSNTKFQIMLLIISLIFYLIIYFILIRYRKMVT